MRDALKAIAEAVRKVVCGIYPPFRTRSVVRLLVLGDSVGGNIPHLGVGVVDNVLLHAQPGAPGLILSIAHATELPEVGLDILVRVLASVSGAQAVFAATLLLCFDIVAVAHVGLFHLDELLGEVVHSLVVVGRVGDFAGGEA